MSRKNNDVQLKLFYKTPETEPTDGGQSIVAEASHDTKLKPRRLKIQYGEYNGSRRRHPVLRLAGFWLKDFGFAIGDIIKVTGGGGMLNIRKVKKAGR